MSQQNGSHLKINGLVEESGHQVPKKHPFTNSLRGGFGCFQITHHLPIYLPLIHPPVNWSVIYQKHGAHLPRKMDGFSRKNRDPTHFQNCPMKFLGLSGTLLFPPIHLGCFGCFFSDEKSLGGLQARAFQDDSEQSLD